MLLYLDICCFNRPFDDQKQYKIYIETEAKLFIQYQIKKNIYKLVWSYMLNYENSANPDNSTKQAIQQWENISVQIVLASDNILKYAEKLQECGFGVKDSIHIACAVEAKAEYFITVDKNILKKKNDVKELFLVNPIEFISMEDEI